MYSIAYNETVKRKLSVKKSCFFLVPRSQFSCGYKTVVKHEL